MDNAQSSTNISVNDNEENVFLPSNYQQPTSTLYLNTFNTRNGLNWNNDNTDNWNNVITDNNSISINSENDFRFDDIITEQEPRSINNIYTEQNSYFNNTNAETGVRFSRGRVFFQKLNKKPSIKTNGKCCLFIVLLNLLILVILLVVIIQGF